MNAASYRILGSRVTVRLNCQHILTESEPEYDSIPILSACVTFMLDTSFAVG